MAHSCSCCSTTSEQDQNSTQHNHDHSHGWMSYTPTIVSFVLLLFGLIFDHLIKNNFFNGYIRFIWYLIAYIPVGYPVIKESFNLLKEKEIFNEFFLMLIATLGAFSIGEYPEGVAVMLFYTIGELFQESAVIKAKGSIKALLDIRPNTASVIRSNEIQIVSPQEVLIGETIQVKVGERVPLDGILTVRSSFDTSALTGESKPRIISEGEKILAGMVNLERVVELKVEKRYEDSALSRILELVQDATSRKAKTELLIRKFAKIYTPIVFLLALCIAILPYLFVDHYEPIAWIYRALVFLVISCPCALVISIPLGYFGGIGAASKYGILFKGANFLETMTKINTIVMDKTGTLTKGVFKVHQIEAKAPLTADELIGIAASIEKHSNHPIAKAISSSGQTPYIAANVEEIAGYGLVGQVDNQEVLVGNEKLLKENDIIYDEDVKQIVDTIVLVAINKKYAGYITIADEEKEDVGKTIKDMYRKGIDTVVVLSGDKHTITQQLANKIGIDRAYGDLLPEDKVIHIEKLKQNPSKVVAFVGDGINDAPALALSDIGIAMGGMGSDAAIEVADVVIQTDEPSRIVTAIDIANATRKIVIQNIVLAFVIKGLVLLLGAGGIATMWEAVFADVGVALLAILNAMRILKKNF